MQRDLLYFMYLILYFTYTVIFIIFEKKIRLKIIHQILRQMDITFGAIYFFV